MNRLLSYLSLFGSLSTIMCCALPALLVALGMGAVFAGLISTFPQLVWLSENKGIVFGVGGILLSVTAILRYRASKLPCPIDPKLAAACKQTRTISFWVFIGSIVLYCVSVLIAFGWPLFA